MKRWLSMLLVLCMVWTMIVPVLAESVSDTEEVEAVEVVEAEVVKEEMEALDSESVAASEEETAEAVFMKSVSVEDVEEVAEAVEWTQAERTISAKASLLSTSYSGIILQKQEKYKTVTHDPGGNLYDSGCGIFAMVNAVGSLTGNYIDPVALADWASSIGAYKPLGGGTDRDLLFHNAVKKYGTSYGFTGNTTVKNDGNTYGTYAGSSSSELVDHLKNGGVAIGHVGGKENGHFIA